MPGGGWGRKPPLASPLISHHNRIYKKSINIYIEQNKPFAADLVCRTIPRWLTELHHATRLCVKRAATSGNQ